MRPPTSFLRDRSGVRVRVCVSVCVCVWGAHSGTLPDSECSRAAGMTCGLVLGSSKSPLCRGEPVRIYDLV